MNTGYPVCVYRGTVKSPLSTTHLKGHWVFGDIIKDDQTFLLALLEAKAQLFGRTVAGK